MRFLRNVAMSILAIQLMAVSVSAHTSYTGYSGAPGSRGTCSISCHNRSAFMPTITVTGFPAEYIPGQQYTIAVSHNGGSTIKQFNASVRVGSGSTNGGVIAAGAGTAVYNVTQETNGVHFTSNDQNTATFLWTAPQAGTGIVRLYFAALQGNLSNGADTAIVQVSNETSTGMDEETILPEMVTLSQNYPNPFNSETIIKFTLPSPGSAELEICNILGQRVYSWSSDIPAAGEVTVRWGGKTGSGTDAPSGVYFYRLRAGDIELARKMIMIR